MQKITPFFWFDSNAEEAVNFYTSIFKNSSIGHVSRYGEDGPGPAGSAMVVPFQLEGQDFLALNGGPIFKFTEAISFTVNCDTQAEIDYFWEKLTEGGSEVQCGWLKDKYGLSWQIVPSIFGKLMQEGTAEQTNRMMKALMQMVKLDIKGLEDAYNSQ